MLTRTAMVRRLAAAAIVAGASSVAPPAAAAEPADAAPAELARRAGCTLCHEAALPPETGAARRVRAPAWETIAARYRGDARAEDRVTAVVLAGTGRLPTDRHWRGEVTLSEMPPNDVQVSAAEARTLVRWILGHTR